MAKLTRRECERLVAAARKARRSALAEYSGFAVGAALLTGDGAVFTGANIESSSYGLSLCAERIAIAAALNRRCGTIRAIAVVAAGRSVVTPCGACRQWLHDFAPTAEVILATLRGKDFIVTTIADLLPRAFGSEMLPRRSGTIIRRKR